MTQSVKASAPASVANVFVGFDSLGFSFAQLHDTVTITRTLDKTRITKITGNSKIPLVMDQNTAGGAILSFLDNHPLDHNLEIEINKGIPLASGLGGSAASAVAAVVAVNQFLDDPLTKEELLPYALEGEKIASGSLHGDNVAASLFGGITAYLSDQKVPTVIPFPLSDNLFAIIIHPHIEIQTRSARNVINKTVRLKDQIYQSMGLTRLLAALYTNQPEYLGAELKDWIIEPQRSHLIPEFDRLQQIAKDNGCIGFTISGAGPACVGLCTSIDTTKQVMKEIQLIQSELPYSISIWNSPLQAKGAQVQEVKR